jgi:hypothetical protein
MILWLELALKNELGAIVLVGDFCCLHAIGNCLGMDRLARASSR